MLLKLVTYIFMMLFVAEAARNVPQKRGRGPYKGGKGGKCRPLAKGIVLDCGNDNDAFKIKDVILTPRKPVPGKPLEIHLIGMLRETIGRGSYVSVKADWGGLNIIDKKEDICKVAAKLKTGHSCPVKPRHFNIRKKIMVPSYAPSGEYHATAFGYSQTKRRIFKIKVKVSL